MAANAQGDRIGPVPEGWDKDWPEVPAVRLSRTPAPIERMGRKSFEKRARAG